MTNAGISKSTASEARSARRARRGPAPFLIALFPVFFLLGLGSGYLLWGRSEPQAQQQSVRRYKVPVDDDPSIGPANAPITIIEFSDYECPYCRRWHLEVFSRLRQEYPTQVRLVYRDFPLTSIHPNAAPAAEAANCANEQGAYWAFNEKLFSGQYGLSPAAYQRYASELNLDTARFEQCLNSGRYRAEVQADLDYAVNLGVRSTPTFFVNGIPVVGAQPYEVFKQLIDKELAGEIP